MLMALISFSASISLTRLFLNATGYPQIGGGELHIAHVLWGGLMLFIAVLLVIILANRRIYTFSAVLGGAGMGLFIDEIGKFITKDNNYFFPAAAPIIYLFFLLIVLIFIQTRRPPQPNPGANLVRALDLIQDMVERPLTNREQKVLQSQLASVVQTAQNRLQTDLAQTILNMVDEDDRPKASDVHSQWHDLLDKLDDWLAPERTRWMLVVGLSGLGLLTWKNPASILLAGHVTHSIEFVLNFHFGNEIMPPVTSLLFQARLFIETIVGCFLFSSAVLLLLRKPIGITLGLTGLLLGLTMLNVLLFYFEQFSTTLVVCFEFFLLIGLAYFREGKRN